MRCGDDQLVQVALLFLISDFAVDIAKPTPIEEVGRNFDSEPSGYRLNVGEMEVPVVWNVGVSGNNRNQIAFHSTFRCSVVPPSEILKCRLGEVGFGKGSSPC